MAGYLSSVNLIAGAGILGNVGGVPISANSAVIQSISDYENIAVVIQFANVRSTGNAVLTSNASVSLRNLASNIFPALTDAVPSTYISSLGNTTVDGFLTLVTSGINNIMGSGDIGKFEQVLNQSVSFQTTTNQLINSAVNANSASADATYISQDVTITGGLSQITQAFRAFGEDLIALGYSIDLADLPNIGSPQALLKQIYSRSNGIPELTTALTEAGISQTIIDNIDSQGMTPEQQKIVFDVMSRTTQSTLVQILKLLQVTTPYLTNLADLLNPVKAFPKSFNTLTAPTVNGIRAIYINSSGAVNTNLETELPDNVLVPLQGYVNTNNTYSQLKKIIPSDWALANKALQAGFEQVKSIFNSTLSELGAAAVNLESNRGLSIINSLTSPLPADVSAFYKNTLVSGTGENGTVLLADIIGSAGGWVVTANLSSATNVISTLTSLGSLNSLTNSTNGVFTVMQNAIDGDYGIPDGMGNVLTIPGGLPGAGTYSTYDLAFTGPGAPGTGLIPAAYSLINTIIANNQENVETANTAWLNIAAQVQSENTLQTQASIEYANLIPGLQPNGLVDGLSSYGLDTSIGGATWLFESVANTSTQGGQAIISTMREARNQVRLQDAGLDTDIVVDDNVPELQISTTSGQYTVQESVDQKII
jgi:hypothetical protein